MVGPADMKAFREDIAEMRAEAHAVGLLHLLRDLVDAWNGNESEPFFDAIDEAKELLEEIGRP